MELFKRKSEKELKKEIAMLQKQKKQEEERKRLIQKRNDLKYRKLVSFGEGLKRTSQNISKHVADLDKKKKRSKKNSYDLYY